MFQNKRILCLIPARGGSKGIPHKNIKGLNGKPLIAYAIKAGLGSKYIDYLMVSTDDIEIANISKEYGAEIPFMRPEELATDTSKTVDAIVHAITELKKQNNIFDVLIHIQPTQPLTTNDDIDKAIETFFENDCRPLVSVKEVDDNPVLIRSIKDGKLKPLLNRSSTIRRQDMPKYYRVNGCIYINRVDEITADTSFNDNIIPFIMEKSHSVDIDTLEDLEEAEFFLRKR